MPDVTEDDDIVHDDEVEEEVSYRDLIEEMKGEVEDFVATMCETYRNVNGRDMRSELSWHIEQAGFGIHRQVEREKRERRQAAQS